MTTPLRASEHLVERAASHLEDRFGLIGNSEPAQAPAQERPPQKSAPAWQLPDLAVPPTAAEQPAATEPAVELPLAALQKAGLVVCGPHRSRVSEEYQVFSTQTLRLLHAAPHGALAGNLLMVTSARPGEGKSFSAINLAASLARDLRSRALLIDGDPKKDSLTERLGLAGRPGLFDLAANPAQKPEPLLVQTAIDGLSVLPIGTIAEAHGVTQQVATLLDRLARRLADRVLILDAPPCLATSDPSMLSSQVSQIIVVVEAERTQRRELDQALDLLAACPNIALMLNKVRFDSANTFGAYGYYGA